MSSATHRMSRVDTAWLRMDTPANLMMIVGVWLITPAIGVQALRERVQQTLLQYDRFRQRVEHDAVGALWVEDEDFDLDEHVVVETLPAGLQGEARLKTRVAELAVEPLDPARPLWKFHLIEDLDGRSAMVVRIHHCIGDGIALMSVTLSLADGGAPPPRRDPQAHDAHEADEDWLADAVVKPLTDLTVKALGMYGDGVVRSIDMLAHPSQPLFGSVDMARAGLQVINDVGALALMPGDSPTRLKGIASGHKQVAWGPPLALDEVKAVGKALGCSVNDVLLACVAGAIGDWLRDQGDGTDGQEIRAMVPVNLRPLDKAWQLGNRFGLVPLVLPIGVVNPVERVYAVRARMNALKGSYQPLLAFAVLAVSGLLVKPAQDAILRLFASKATAVMTNVPGPSAPLRFCGSTVEQMMFWVPQSGDIGMGVSVLSYRGGVQFGLITDSAMCADPQAIIDRFAPEFDKLLWLSLMLPWGEAAAPGVQTAPT